MEINPFSLSNDAFQSSTTHEQLHTYNIAAVKGLSPKKNQLSYLQYMESILQSVDDKCYFIRPTPQIRVMFRFSFSISGTCFSGCGNLFTLDFRFLWH